MVEFIEQKGSATVDIYVNIVGLVKRVALLEL
jgi:hypothetical protein